MLPAGQPAPPLSPYRGAASGGQVTWPGAGQVAHHRSAPPPFPHGSSSACSIHRSNKSCDCIADFLSSIIIMYIFIKLGAQVNNRPRPPDPFSGFHVMSTVATQQLTRNLQASASTCLLCLCLVCQPQATPVYSAHSPSSALPCLALLRLLQHRSTPIVHVAHLGPRCPLEEENDEAACAQPDTESSLPGRYLRLAQVHCFQLPVTLARCLARRQARSHVHRRGHTGQEWGLLVCCGRRLASFGCQQPVALLVHAGSSRHHQVSCPLCQTSLLLVQILLVANRSLSPDTCPFALSSPTGRRAYCGCYVCSLQGWFHLNIHCPCPPPRYTHPRLLRRVCGCVVAPPQASNGCHRPPCFAHGTSSDLASSFVAAHFPIVARRKTRTRARKAPARDRRRGQTARHLRRECRAQPERNRHPTVRFRTKRKRIVAPSTEASDA